MKTLELKNGKKVSLERNSSYIKTGEVTFGFASLVEPNKFSGKYQIDLLYDSDDKEFEKILKEACKEVFDKQNKRKLLGDNPNIKDFKESPFKEISEEFLSKLDEHTKKIYENKKRIKLTSKEPISIYNKDGKIVSPELLKLGYKGSCLLNISAYNVGVNKGFKAYPVKILVANERFVDSFTFFDDGTPLERAE